MAEIIKGVLLEGNTTGLIDYNSLTNAPIFGDGTAKSHVEAWIAETESALEDREKEALYCYYDAATKKIYQDKEFTIPLYQKDIRSLVGNNNKNYQRQVYCYWPTYKPGNQGRYLRLTQLGGSDTEARFMNIFPVDGNYRFCSIRITGETHPTAPNTVYAEEKTFDFNTMESEITRLLEGVPYIIQGLINTNEIEDTGNYNKCPISLTKDGKSVSYNEIKKQALAGRLVYCEFDQRRIPLLTVKKEGNTESLTFQAQLNQTFYQISVKSDNTQTLIWGPLAFGREVDKIINELYDVEDGKIPQSEISRIDNLQPHVIETEMGKIIDTVTAGTIYEVSLKFDNEYLDFDGLKNLCKTYSSYGSLYCKAFNRLIPLTSESDTLVTFTSLVNANQYTVQAKSDSVFKFIISQVAWKKETPLYLKPLMAGGDISYANLALYDDENSALLSYDQIAELVETRPVYIKEANGIYPYVGIAYNSGQPVLIFQRTMMTTSRSWLVYSQPPADFPENVFIEYKSQQFAKQENVAELVNELYNITDGIIPEDGNSRLDLIEKKIEDLYGKGTFICWTNVLNGQKVIADSAFKDATPYTFRELYKQINQNPLSFCIYHLTTGYKVCALVSYEDINLEYNEKGHIIFSSTEYIIEDKTTKLHLATITGDDFVNFGTSIIASNPTLKSVVNELYNVTDGVIPENGNSRLDNIESLLQRTGYLYFHPKIVVDGYLDGFISRGAEDGTPLSAEELQVLIEEKGEGNVILKDNSGAIYSLNVVNSNGYRFFAGSLKRMRQVILYNNSTKPSDMMQEYNCRYSDRNLDDEVNNLQSQIDKLNTEILAQLSIIVDGGV